MTPMMEQYFEIKEKYKDYLLFYRLGDFYEMFFDDAKTASRELDLVLIGSKAVVRIVLFEEHLRLFSPGANRVGGMLRTADAFGFTEHFRNDPHPFFNRGGLFVVNAGKTAVAAI